MLSARRINVTVFVIVGTVCIDTILVVVCLAIWLFGGGTELRWRAVALADDGVCVSSNAQEATIFSMFYGRLFSMVPV